MCEALRRLMKDEIEETLEKATKEAIQTGLEKGMEEGRAKGHAEGRAEGRAEGQAQTQKKTSIALAKMGMSVENIASAVDATIAQVQNWINGNDIKTAETAK